MLYNTHIKLSRAYRYVELDIFDMTLTPCRVFTQYLFRMNIDNENDVKPVVCSLLDTGHSKQEIRYP